jgi:mono/diheme cytochrome c family protein
MLRLTVGVVAVTFVAGGVWPSLDQHTNKVDRGKQVYTEQKCKLCHSVAGEGNAKGPLDGVGSKLTRDQIKEWIIDPQEMTTKTKATRKPAMKAYPKLPAEDLEAIVSYMESLKAK